MKWFRNSKRLRKKNLVSSLINRFSLPHTRCTSRLLANLVQCALQSEPLVISLNRDHYIRRQDREFHLPYTHIRASLNALEESGLISRQRGFLDRTTGKGRRTRLHPTQLLRDSLEAHTGYKMNSAQKPPASLQVVDEKPEVILKDENKVPLRNAEIPAHLICEVKAINRNKFSAYLPETNTEYQVKYSRIFNEDFHRGGRFYSEIQNLHKEERAGLLLDGSPVVELDYSGCHPRLMYRELGIKPPTNLYPATQTDKKTQKLVFLIATNAKCRKSAIGAIQEAKQNGDLDTGLSPSQLLDIIEESQPVLKQFFYSGMGSRLQKKDGDIARDVLLTFADMKKPIICMHDGFTVRAEDEDILREVMIHQWKRHTGQEPLVKVDIKNGKVQ